MTTITPRAGPPEGAGPPFMYRVKSPAGIVDYPSPAEGQPAYTAAKAALLPGETASYHRCAHSTVAHPGGGKPGAESPELWYDCRRDAQGQYEEYTAP